MTKDQAKLLIVGGTGKSGRRVRRELTRRGIAHRSASASATPPFLWEDEATWAPHLVGIESVYLSYFPDLAVPGAASQIGNFAQRAVATGTRRIVLLSGRGEPQTEPSERAVAESGAAWTVLRCAFFCQNFSEGFMADDVRAGELQFPAADVREPFVDLDDVAEVAALALTSDAHAGKIYDLSGPRLVGFAEAMASISSATGQPLRYVPVTHAAYADTLHAVLPAPMAGFLSELFAFVLDGHNSHVSDDLPKLLRRPARDFETWARTTAETGVWRQR